MNQPVREEVERQTKIRAFEAHRIRLGRVHGRPWASSERRRLRFVARPADLLVADPPDISGWPGLPERVLREVARMNKEALEDAKALGLSSIELERRTHAPRARGDLRTEGSREAELKPGGSSAVASE
jgi:hypothetical protein